MEDDYTFVKQLQSLERSQVKKANSLIDYRSRLSKENLFEKEYEEVLQLHNSKYYQDMDNEGKHDLDEEMYDRLRIMRQELKHLRLPPLTDKELTEYLGSRYDY